MESAMAPPPATVSPNSSTERGLSPIIPLLQDFLPALCCWFAGAAGEPGAAAGVATPRPIEYMFGQLELTF
jgi:hypothetical protein